MARRSLRGVGVSSSQASARHKRIASTDVTPDSNKRSRKQGNDTTLIATTTTTTGSAFDSGSEASPSEDEASAFSEDSNTSDHEPESESVLETEDSDSEFDSRNKTKAKRQTPKKYNAVGTGHDQISSQSYDATDLEPGKRVVIKVPTARPPGKTPYRDEYIHPNTFTFLAELKANNQRSWLKFHDAQFRQAEKDWYSLIDKITERIVEIDDTIPELPVKDLIFRIYRDVRFSKDPTPYKSHFSAAWSRTGRKSDYAVYYLRIAPGDSFIAGGLWHPDAAKLASMRTVIDTNSRRFKNVLLLNQVRDAFLGGASNESKIMKAFISGSNEDALKTKPKGYDSGHADIDLLRLRSYVLGKKLKDEEVIGPGALESIATYLAALKPFVTFLNSIVMPDEHEEEEEAEEDGTEEEQESEVDEVNDDDDEQGEEMDE